MKHVAVARRNSTRAAGLVAAFAVVASSLVVLTPATALGAPTTPLVVSSSGDIAGWEDRGSGIDSPWALDQHLGEAALRIDTPNNKNVTLMKPMIAADATPDTVGNTSVSQIADLLSQGVSYTTDGNNTNFQISMRYKPANPSAANDGCGTRSDYPSGHDWAGWCWTILKYEPTVGSDGTWVTRDVTAVLPGSTPGWWGNTTRSIGANIPAQTWYKSDVSFFTDEMSELVIDAIGFSVGSAAGADGSSTFTTWLKNVTFGGTSYVFTGAPSTPAVTSAGLADGRDFTVSWTAPEFDGGSAITGYSVSLYEAGNSSPLTTASVGAVTSHTFVGDFSGSLYATVSAINAAGASDASAASATVVVPPKAVTVGEGGYATIQAAINAVAPGGVVSVPAGTYLGDIKVRDKSLTLVGIGEPGTVVIQQKASGGEAKMIDLYNSTDVLIENIVVRGDASNPTKASGIDINSATNITLRGVVVDGLQKNGISVTGQWRETSPLVSHNITLDGVTASDNAWAGIAFYTKNKAQTHSVGISGVTFSGVTTISGGGAGIQFGDPGDSDAVTGAGSDAVVLGTVNFVGVGGDEILLQDTSSLVIDRASTIDGRAVTSSDFSGSIDVIPLIGTSTTITGSAAQIDRRGELELTATVTPAADGTVTFSDGATVIGTAEAVDGTASITASLSALGAHNITASFAPTLAADYAPSASAALTVTVVAPSAITVGQGGYATLADALAEIAEGGTITLPAGAVVASGTLSVSTANVTVKGAQAGITAATGPRSQTLSSGESVLSAVVQVSAAGVTFDGIEFANSGAQNLRLLGKADITVKNSRFTAGTHGITEFNGASGALYSDNLFDGVTRALVFDRPADDLGSPAATVSGNTFRNGQNGISTAAHGVTITGNTFEAFTGRAIGVYGTETVISGNSFAVPAAAGGVVLIADASQDASGVAITGNTFRGAGTAIVVQSTADSKQGTVGASYASGNSFIGTGLAVQNLDDAAFDARGNWWNNADGAPSAQLSGAVTTSGYLTPKFASYSVSTNAVANGVTSVTPSYTLVNASGVSVGVTGASGLVVGANTVTFTAKLTVNGATYTEVRTLGVTRAAVPPVVIPPVVPEAPQAPEAPQVPETPTNTPAPATTVEQLADTVGATTEQLLERYREANGGQEPPAAAQVFSFPAGSAPAADGSFLRDKTFTANVPWTDASGDAWVDVWAYSTPVFIGTFPVVDGVLQISGADLSALEAGGHHLVMIGQTSGTSQVAAIDLADAPAAEAPAETPGPDTSEDAAGADGGPVDSGLFVALIIGLVLALLVAGAITVVVRQRRA